MKFRRLVATIGCVCLISSTSLIFYAYAENESQNVNVVDKINHSENLDELDAYMQQMLGQKIKLTSDKRVEKVSKVSETSDYVIMSKAEYLRDQNGEDVEGSLLTEKELKRIVSSGKETKASRTLSEFNLDDAKKVYLYSDELMGKIQKGTALDDEAFSWQLPIVNALGENGIIYLEKSEATDELITTSIEFPVDNREMFLSNEEIVELVNGSIDNTANIEAIYFVDMPISIMGTVVGIVVLDSGDIMFATVQDMPYYNGMEFRQVYTFDEMMDYLEVFEKKAQGWINNSHLQ